MSRPTDAGGLGFGYKWDMGWMHDTLEYLRRDPVHRRYHHDQITFRGLYAFTENYVLPLSHDEVVHGKGSLLGAMPGDDWQRFANLRLLYGYQFAQPGKKLLFMGGELGQWNEWSHEHSLEWGLLDYERHSELLRWVRDLNHRYREQPALHELDCDPSGFEWVEVGDAGQSTLGFLRRSAGGDSILVVCNFTPVPRHDLTVGVPDAGLWREILNSDDKAYGGSGVGNPGLVESVPLPCSAKPCSMNVTAPPLAVVFLRREIAATP